jgi:outer membrane protein
MRMVRTFFSVVLIFSSTLGFSQERKVWNLDTCIGYAQQNNIQINRSKLNIERVEQDQLNSKASLFPSLNARVSQGFNFGTDPFSGATTIDGTQYGNYDANLSFDIFRGLSKMNDLKRDQSNLLVQKFETERMQNDISLNIATAYLQILFQKELLKVAQEQVDISQLQVDRIQQMFEAGQVPNADLLDIKAQLANDELTRVQAQNNLNLAYVNLVQLMQLPLEEQQGFDIEIPDLEAFEERDIVITPKEIYNAALVIMPEIKRDREAIATNELSYRSTKGNFWPRLSLSAGVGSRYSSDGSEPVWGNQLNDNLNYQTGLSLQIPIYNGLSVRTGTQQAEIRIRESQYNLQETQNNLEQAIQSAYYDAIAAKQKYLASQIAVTSLTESFTYSELRFEEGVINQVEYNQVKTNLTQAQSDLVQSKYDYIFRLKILDFYQGKPLTF